MTKAEIINKLKENHQAFADHVAGLSESDFILSKDGKWTAGQQLDHICRGVKPLLQAFMLPKMVIGTMFGKAEEDSMGYDELVAKYHKLLADGGKASGKFIPESIPPGEGGTLRAELLTTVESLTKKIEKFSEEDLDKYRLPHPLIGKLTLCEMLHFTIYHVEHHHYAVIRNLE